MSILISYFLLASIIHQSSPSISARLRNYLNCESSSSEIDLELDLQGAKCSLCQKSVDFIQKTVRKSHDYRLDAYARLMCVLLSVSDVLDPVLNKNTSLVDDWIDLCEHAYLAYKPFVVTILEKSNLSSRQMCQMMDICPNDDPLVNWTVNIPDYRKSRPKRDVQTVKNAGIRILHLSDIHIQTNYVRGSEAICGRPVCCFGPVVDDPARKAGYFGDYRKCDLPKWTFEAILDYIAKNEKFDLIYWTGDAASHQIWNQSHESNLNDSLYVLDRFYEYFPQIPVYSSFGNHDNFPCNMFKRSDGGNPDRIYGEIADKWRKLGRLSKAEARLIEKSGIYSVLIRPRLRLISLNTNYGTQENFWLYINPVDPENQLKWLIKLLLDCENRREKVHIIGHHFPGRGLSGWSNNYYRIVRRFNQTIKAQFFGHEHEDYFTLFLTADRLKPFSLAFMSPSLTTYLSNDPVFKIFEVDLNSSSLGEITDYSSSVVDLAKSNNQKSLIIRRENSFKTQFNLSNLTLDSFMNVFERSRQNDFDNEVMDELVRRRFHSLDKRRNCRGFSCRRSFSCLMVSSNRNWTNLC